MHDQTQTIKESFQVKDLGLIPYPEAYRIQMETLQEVISGAADTLLLCEHPAVLTLGRMATEANILMPQQDIARVGVSVVRIDRGGEVTLHCPGQLVMYPILNLNKQGRDLKRYLFTLEQVVIDLLRDFDILARRISGQRGVWVGPHKIASIGIGVKKWVAYHGAAININSDLRLFSTIRPCGLDVEMTSMARLMKSKVNYTDVKLKAIHYFARHFHNKD